ncbi:MAG: tripartite tricarboxylate transporter permease [Salinarimonadaceae bacterium]|nr:MAG: tripartite tricarboxylate transporter permease [Salinarimonadaceae bacterium]
MELFTVGFPTALSFQNLIYCFTGVFLGTLIGVLPGIGPLAAISLLLPITMYLEPTAALVMLAGVYYGAQYGGSTTAILLNLPGCSSSAITALDGYAMRRNGRAGAAIFITTLASFIGGSIGILLLTTFATGIAQAARMFGAAEYFAAMLLALIMASTIAQGSVLKGYLMVLVGVLLGCVGLDVNSGVARFELGFLQLYEGISMIIVAIGLFGVSEIIISLTSKSSAPQAGKVPLRSLIPTRDEMRRMWAPTFRGTAIGGLFGALPGVGANVATYCAYAFEKRVARDKSKFGKGAVEGVASPEAANNAGVQTAFIPTLLLGIPGSATMAVMLGALMIHGIAAGPRLMTQQPELFWGLIASFWIGNVLLVILNIPLIGIWVALLRIPYKLLYPAILALICIGTYSLRYSYFDIWLVLIFGVVGYILRVLRFEPAPLLIGFVLGPMVEENLRRAMILAHGDIGNLLQRPIAGTILAIAAIVLVATFISQYRDAFGARRDRDADGDAVAASPAWMAGAESRAAPGSVSGADPARDKERDPT